MRPQSRGGRKSVLRESSSAAIRTCGQARKDHLRTQPLRFPRPATSDAQSESAEFRVAQETSEMDSSIRHDQALEPWTQDAMVRGPGFATIQTAFPSGHQRWRRFAAEHPEGRENKRVGKECRS